MAAPADEPSTELNLTATIPVEETALGAPPIPRVGVRALADLPGLCVLCVVGARVEVGQQYTVAYLQQEQDGFHTDAYVDVGGRIEALLGAQLRFLRLGDVDVAALAIAGAGIDIAERTEATYVSPELSCTLMLRADIPVADVVRAGAFVAGEQLYTFGRPELLGTGEALTTGLTLRF